MRPPWFCLMLLTGACLARDWQVILLDETGRRLPGGQVEAVLMPPDDPRLSSVVARIGQTDADGVFRFAAEDQMILTRLRAAQAGHHEADADHRHGLGRARQDAVVTLTLPRAAERVPLHYREIRLSGLPIDRWVGFDAEAADAVAPWGKGKSADFDFRITWRQVGWTESPETLAHLRRSQEGVRMDETEWAQAYGRFEGEVSFAFPRKGDGIMKTPAFWPYCRLMMPGSAPAEGYESVKRFSFDTLEGAEAARDFTGCFLRLRSETAADGRILSAHYAKIHGRVGASPGRVTFRLYFNPRRDDRRLAFAPGLNLLRPGPGEPVHAFETQQP